MPDRRDAVKLQTIASGRQIEQTLLEGKRSVADPFVVYILAKNAEEPAVSAVAIQVPRKVGKAVRRNRIRRIVKEVLRKLFPRFPSPFRVIVIARPRAALLGYHEVSPLLERLFEREGILPGSTPPRDDPANP